MCIRDSYLAWALQDADGQRRVQIWNMRIGRFQRDWLRPDEPLVQLVFEQDDRSLLSVMSSGMVRRWPTIGEGNPRAFTFPVTTRLGRVMPLPAGGAVVNQDGEVWLYDCLLYTSRCV